MAEMKPANANTYGGSADASRVPPESENRRQTGARKWPERPDLHEPDILDTGDPGDKPKKPFGLAAKD